MEDFERQWMRAWRMGGGRGDFISRFLEQKIGVLENKSIVDCGCASGGIAIELSKYSKLIVGVEYDDEAIAYGNRRLVPEKLQNVHFVRGQLPDLPLSSGQCDIALLMGVLEWVAGGWGPLTHQQGDPEDKQLRTLTEVHRVLRPGGSVYLGMENRWFPLNLLKDPHAKHPLVAWLPRWAANRLSLWHWNERYVNYLYSWRTLKDLFMRVGFSQVQVHVAIYHYQFPLALVRVEDSRALLRAAWAAPTDVEKMSEWERLAVVHRGRAKRIFMVGLAALGLQHCFVPDFVVWAVK